MTSSPDMPPAPPAPPPGPPAEWRLPLPHPAGYPFAAVPAGLAALSLLAGWPILFWLALLLTAAVLLFFRDPDRVSPREDGLLLAPADGLVIQVADVDVPRQLQGETGMPEARATRISIFLSVLDVHINRTPVSGTVKSLTYVPGKFLNASLDKASDDNERSYMVVEAFDGTRVGVTQIAGLIARRIVTFVAPGAILAPGQRYGLIRFGSRTDLYLPEGWTPTVLKGQRTVGGETILARRLEGNPGR
jgi:phosphatidylserine decarboxylase